MRKGGNGKVGQGTGSQDLIDNEERILVLRSILWIEVVVIKRKEGWRGGKVRQGTGSQDLMVDGRHPRQQRRLIISLDISSDIS